MKTATGPSVWTGAELAHSDEWILRLTPEDLAELDIAVAGVERAQIPLQ